MKYYLGWDIGGANIKATLVSSPYQASQVKHANKYYEMWNDYNNLVATLQQITSQLTNDLNVEMMTVTITAELADSFRTKREGIHFIINSLKEALPVVPLKVLTTEGTFVCPEKAINNPLSVAAANWAATAYLLAPIIPNCYLMDMGSTTVDIIPIKAGQVVSLGKTDPERLESGELVYTGLLRTSVATLVDQVPVLGKWIPVSREFFVNTGDIYLLLEYIQPEQYTVNTPDGRPPQPEYAKERLARLICADREMLTEQTLITMAQYISEKQIQLISTSLWQVASRFPQGAQWPVILTGLGAFLCKKCAARLQLQSMTWDDIFHDNTSLAAPSYAAAMLLIKELEKSCK